MEGREGDEDAAELAKVPSCGGRAGASEVDRNVHPLWGMWSVRGVLPWGELRFLLRPPICQFRILLVERKRGARGLFRGCCLCSWKISLLSNCHPVAICADWALLMPARWPRRTAARPFTAMISTFPTRPRGKSRPRSLRPTTSASCCPRMVPPPARDRLVGPRRHRCARDF